MKHEDADNILMVEIDKSFQKEIFNQVYRKYKTDLASGNRLGIPSFLFASYKNCKTKTINLSVFDRVVEELNINKKEVENKIIRITSRAQQSRDSLKKFNDKWKTLKEEINLEDCLAHKNKTLSLDVNKWLKKSNYIERIKRVPAIIDIKRVKYSNDKIYLTYKYFNPHKNKKEIFTRIIPSKLNLDEEFMYFVGLWCGDRFRVGLSNSCLDLLKFTSYFLNKRLKQPTSLIMGEVLSSRNLPKNEWTKHVNILKSLGIYKIRKRVDKRDYIKKKSICYAILLSNNFVLWHILKSLEKNLDLIFYSLKKNNRFAFYAGFFDAEGHVDKYHQRLEFYQFAKNMQIIEPVIKYLKHDGFDVCYYKDKAIRIPTKSNLRNRNFRLFKEKILPYIKHPEKISEAKELITGTTTKKQYSLLLYWILKNPGKTSKSIAVVFSQSYVHTLLKISALKKDGLLERTDFKYKITQKGRKWLNRNEEYLCNIIKELRLESRCMNGMYRIEYPAVKELVKNIPSSLVR